eukprot:TRINITY_DN14940_c0_g3_i1.p1 TRINITY_DN14940_c0_g3~~TRINITY_DN14940_c0_g3_i1.p1  ORF type:complete len:899 (+),score=140.04 TRINITY_DN14940_c0_g3_i1:69-2699(+)
MPLPPSSEHDPFELLLQDAQAQLQVLSNTVNSLAQRYSGMKLVPVDEACVIDVDAHGDDLENMRPEIAASLFTVLMDPHAATVPAERQPVEVEEAYASSRQIAELTPENTSKRQPFDCDKPSADPSDTQEALLTAAASGDLQAANRALQEGADPNMSSDIRCFKKDFFNCTPLAVAILKGYNDLANLLCRSNADPNATYAFEAGRKLRRWTGPITFAATPKGNLPLLLDLIGHRADIHKIASNGASLVWQAGYMGHVDMCRTMIEMLADIEQKAANVDDEELQHSPLHIAAKTGQISIVELLVEHKARLDVTDGKGHHPLDDAVLEGHSHVLKLLISSGDNPWRQLKQETASKLLRMFTNQAAAVGTRTGVQLGKDSTTGTRSIDLVFVNKNPILMSAIATGLGNAPSMLDQMSSSDFLQFLKCPGDAPLKIMDAIFQQYTFSSWTRDDEGELLRVQHHSAFTPRDGNMVVMSGPHHQTLKELFDNKKEPPEPIRNFIDTFVPVRPPLTRSCRNRGTNGQVLAKITCTMCHISGLHEDLEVLMAIVDSPSMELFEATGCRAIIHHKWKQERRGAFCYTGMTFAEVISLFLVNILLNSQEKEISYIWTVLDRQAVLQGVNLLGIMLWLLSFFLDIVCKMNGYRLNGLLPKFIASWACWYHLLLKAATLAVHVTVRAWLLEASREPGFCVMFGVLILLKWGRFLKALTRVIPAVGVSILPIFTTMFDIGSFCGTLFIILMGLTNLYYALGIYDLFNSFMLMYRLGVLTDGDQTELLRAAESVISSSDHSVYYWTIRYGFVAVSFIIGLSMMNVFIAVLSEKFAKAQEGAAAAFVRERARMFVDFDAVREGFRHLFCMKRNQEQKREHLWIAQREASDL